MGHEVEIVTGLPNYPVGEILSGYERCFYRREVRDGVIVHRVWLYPALGSGIKRILNYTSFTLTSLFGLLRAEKPDYIFVESPPLTLSVPAYIAGAFWGVPFIFNVSDLWPDAIIDGRFLKNGFLLRCLTALERWSYREAAYVNAVTEGIRQSLLTRKSVPAGKILFLPNGVDTIRFQPRPSDASLKKQLGLEGKRIILWPGTLGYHSAIESVLQSAKLLEGQPEIHFLFLGDGSARAGLERLRDQMGLRNVTFHNPVPLEQVPLYISIGEIGLASLSCLPLWEATRPAKLFPILASGKPVIFAGVGEAARLVRQAGAGLVVPPENPRALADAVMELLGSPEASEELGRNGRRFVESHFQWSQLVGSWVARLEQLHVEAALTSGVTGS
jgi:glycosyltransferase involved in cell wall biosynthesis